MKALIVLLLIASITLANTSCQSETSDSYRCLLLDSSCLFGVRCHTSTNTFHDAWYIAFEGVTLTSLATFAAICRPL